MKIYIKFLHYLILIQINFILFIVLNTFHILITYSIVLLNMAIPYYHYMLSYIYIYILPSLPLTNTISHSSFINVLSQSDILLHSTNIFINIYVHTSYIYTLHIHTPIITPIYYPDYTTPIIFSSLPKYYYILLLLGISINPYPPFSYYISYVFNPFYNDTTYIVFFFYNLFSIYYILYYKSYITLSLYYNSYFNLIIS